jgi:hypothetical protein
MKIEEEKYIPIPEQEIKEIKFTVIKKRKKLEEVGINETST